MTRVGIRPISAIAALVLAAAALVACGGSGSGESASSSSEAASKHPDAETGAGGSGNGGSQSKKGDGSGKPIPKVEAAPLKVTGGGSAQYHVKGGDNSIQDFGEESAESELEEAATALHDFYVARAAKGWGAACSRLSKAVRQQLQQLAARSEKLSGAGCAGILSALTPPLPPKVQKESTIVDAGSLRTEGERAFLIYRGAEATVYAIPMTQEGGAWKVGALGATPLS